MEADFNFNNKLLGRDVMTCAEANNNIPQEQYGSQKHKTSILHAVNKRLLYNIIHLECSAILCSCAAKTCFDCIVHSIGSVTLQHLGMPLQPIQCILTSIQDLEHYIPTTYGTLTNFMTNASLTSFQRILQGNGARPTIWVTVSAPLIEMMQGVGHRIKFEEK